MATGISISSTYAGQDAGVYISAAIKAANTIEQDVITVMPNIALKAVLHKVDLADATQDFTCDFNPTGSVTLAEAVLTPKKLMVPLQLCKEDFRVTWESESMGFSAKNENLPATFEEYFIAKVIEKQATKIDSNIWSGTTGTAGEFGGFVTAWEADSGTNEIDALTGSIDASNVQEYLGSIYDSTPDAVMASDDFQFVVSLKVAKAYRRSLSAQGFRNDYSVGEKPLDFEGLELKVLNNAPANFIATFNKENLYFGTGLMSDHNEISILDMHDVDLSDNVRFKMVYTGGTQYVVPGEITYYYSA
jgi:hypothetical protein